jgi:NADH-quinone oxidoreductase subunit N
MIDSFYTGTDHFSIVPALMLALFGCAILLFDFLIFPDPRQRKWLLIFVVLAEGFTGCRADPANALDRRPAGPIEAFNGSVIVDDFSIFFNWMFLIAALIVAVVSYQYLETPASITANITA